MAPQACRIETGHSLHIPRTSSRRRPGFRAFGGLRSFACSLEPNGVHTLTISRSSVRSATIFFSRAFSSSSCFSRFISVGNRPAYVFFQLKSVAWLITAFRQISATGVPSSPCLMMNAFCASEPMVHEVKTSMPSSRFRPSPSQESVAENSSFKRSSFQGSGQCRLLLLRAGKLFIKAKDFLGVAGQPQKRRFACQTKQAPSQDQLTMLPKHRFTAINPFGFISLIILFLIPALPMTFMGFGSDNDIYGVLSAGHRTWEENSPTMSRHPGYWLHEGLVYLLDSLGSYFMVNWVTLAASIFLLYRFWVVSDSLDLKWRFPLGLCIAWNPWYLIASTSGIDYIWAMLFIFVSIEAFARQKPVSAATLGAIAVGFRLGSIFALIGAAFLSFLLNSGPKRLHFVVFHCFDDFYWRCLLYSILVRLE
jgi:hypothetical protein